MVFTVKLGGAGRKIGDGRRKTPYLFYLQQTIGNRSEFLSAPALFSSYTSNISCASRFAPSNYILNNFKGVESPDFTRIVGVFFGILVWDLLSQSRLFCISGSL